MGDFLYDASRVHDTALNNRHRVVDNNDDGKFGPGDQLKFLNKQNRWVSYDYKAGAKKIEEAAAGLVAFAVWSRRLEDYAKSSCVNKATVEEAQGEFNNLCELASALISPSSEQFTAIREKLAKTVASINRAWNKCEGVEKNQLRLSFGFSDDAYDLEKVK